MGSFYDENGGYHHELNPEFTPLEKDNSDESTSTPSGDDLKDIGKKHKIPLYKRFRRWWKKKRTPDKIFYSTETIVLIYSIISFVINLQPHHLINVLWICTITFLYYAWDIKSRRDKYYYYMKGSLRVRMHFFKKYIAKNFPTNSTGNNETNN